ncbi:uncharacterized protein LOC135828586 [Sycon ciliatum]|uniref:uncharacterized protein LOC135828586 n=1 Tax=Sycon ciliatum TaxID=27933 RepID=UPI0031F6520E
MSTATFSVVTISPTSLSPPLTTATPPLPPTGTAGSTFISNSNLVIMLLAACLLGTMVVIGFLVWRMSAIKSKLRRISMPHDSQPVRSGSVTMPTHTSSMSAAVTGGDTPCGETSSMRDGDSATHSLASVVTVAHQQRTSLTSADGGTLNTLSRLHELHMTMDELVCFSDNDEEQPSSAVAAKESPLATSAAVSPRATQRQVLQHRVAARYSLQHQDTKTVSLDLPSHSGPSSISDAASLPGLVETKPSTPVSQPFDVFTRHIMDSSSNCCDLPPPTVATTTGTSPVGPATVPHIAAAAAFRDRDALCDGLLRSNSMPLVGPAGVGQPHSQVPAAVVSRDSRTKPGSSEPGHHQQQLAAHRSICMVKRGPLLLAHSVPNIAQNSIDCGGGDESAMQLLHLGLSRNMSAAAYSSERVDTATARNAPSASAGGDRGPERKVCRLYEQPLTPVNPGRTRWEQVFSRVLSRPRATNSEHSVANMERCSSLSAISTQAIGGRSSTHCAALNAAAPETGTTIANAACRTRSTEHLSRLVCTDPLSSLSSLSSNHMYGTVKYMQSTTSAASNDGLYSTIRSPTMAAAGSNQLLYTRMADTAATTGANGSTVGAPADSASGAAANGAPDVAGEVSSSPSLHSLSRHGTAGSMDYHRHRQTGVAASGASATAGQSQMSTWHHRALAMNRSCSVPDNLNCVISPDSPAAPNASGGIFATADMDGTGMLHGVSTDAIAPWNPLKYARAWKRKVRPPTAATALSSSASATVTYATPERKTARSKVFATSPRAPTAGSLEQVAQPQQPPQRAREGSYDTLYELVGSVEPTSGNCGGGAGGTGMPSIVADRVARLESPTTSADSQQQQLQQAGAMASSPKVDNASYAKLNWKMRTASNPVAVPAQSHCPPAGGSTVGAGQSSSHSRNNSLVDAKQLGNLNQQQPEQALAAFSPGTSQETSSPFLTDGSLQLSSHDSPSPLTKLSDHSGRSSTSSAKAAGRDSILGALGTHMDCLGSDSRLYNNLCGSNGTSLSQYDTPDTGTTMQHRPRAVRRDSMTGNAPGVLKRDLPLSTTTSNSTSSPHSRTSSAGNFAAAMDQKPKTTLQQLRSMSSVTTQLATVSGAAIAPMPTRAALQHQAARNAQSSLRGARQFPRRLSHSFTEDSTDREQSMHSWHTTDTTGCKSDDSIDGSCARKSALYSRPQRRASEQDETIDLGRQAADWADKDGDEQDPGDSLSSRNAPPPVPPRSDDLSLDSADVSVIEQAPTPATMSVKSTACEDTWGYPDELVGGRARTTSGKADYAELPFSCAAYPGRKASKRRPRTRHSFSAFGRSIIGERYRLTSIKTDVPSLSPNKTKGASTVLAYQSPVQQPQQHQQPLSHDQLSMNNSCGVEPFSGSGRPRTDGSFSSLLVSNDSSSSATHTSQRRLSCVSGDELYGGGARSALVQSTTNTSDGMRQQCLSPSSQLSPHQSLGLGSQLPPQPPQLPRHPDLTGSYSDLQSGAQPQYPHRRLSGDAPRPNGQYMEQKRRSYDSPRGGSEPNFTYAKPMLDDSNADNGYARVSFDKP